MAKKQIYPPYYFQYRWMRQVCECPNHPNYQTFGGRGIQCHWGPRTFREFESWLLNTLGPKPGPDYVLGRLDKKGDFAPGNLAWQLKKQSCRANTQQNVYASYRNKKKPLAQWAEELGIPYWSLRRRISKGIPLKDIIKEFK